MKCTLCGYDIPEGTAYCPKCGAAAAGTGVAEWSVTYHDTDDTTVPMEPVYAERPPEYLGAGGAPRGTAPVGAVPVYPATPEKKKGAGTAAVIVLASLAAVLLLLNVYQFWMSERTDSENKKEIALLNGDIDELKNTVELLENGGGKAEYFDRIANALQAGTPGYSSESFNVSSGIVVLDGDTRTATLELIVDFGQDARVHMDCDTGAARVEFTQTEWQGSATQLRLTAVTPGVTVATFTNSYNAEQFEILIIVKD